WRCAIPRYKGPSSPDRRDGCARGDALHYGGDLPRGGARRVRAARGVCGGEWGEPRGRGLRAAARAACLVAAPYPASRRAEGRHPLYQTRSVLILLDLDGNRAWGISLNDKACLSQPCNWAPLSVFPNDWDYLDAIGTVECIGDRCTLPTVGGTAGKVL